ncbi:MAG TPA: WXG100 family type VII secretion target [Acidimicrobiales bacterium]|nr:WXG100 family type VII secretion target [Acidimicrobiales bacterium]
MPIAVTPERLRGSASTLTTGSSNIGAELGRLLSDVRDLQATWDGRAAAAFDGSYTAANEGFKQVESALTSIAEMLRRSADQYEEQDQRLASQFAV